MPKLTVTLSIDPTVWLAFRALAIAKGSNASREVERFMKETLDKTTLSTVSSDSEQALHTQTTTEPG